MNLSTLTESRKTRTPSFIFSAFIFSIIITSLFSCKGDDGNVGPAGSKGDTGETGATGAQGATGTANVIYSAWKYASSFADSTVDNSAYKVGTVSAAQLTTDVLNKGDVHVYMTYGGGVVPLPYTSNAGGKPNTISFWPKLSRITVNRFTHDNSNSIALSTLLQYRYVIIPGGVAGRMAAPDFNDYHAVCKFYGIPE